MEPCTYRTQNYQQSLASIRSLFLLLAVLTLPAVVIVVGAMSVTKEISPHVKILIIGALASGIAVEMVLPWLYYRGYRDLTFTIDDSGLRVRFLRTLFVPWSEVLAVEKVRPGAIIGARLCGLGWTVSHGLFSTKLGRAWLWLAAEPEALFIRTTRRNYLLAPERLDEFKQKIEAQIKKR